MRSSHTSMPVVRFMSHVPSSKAAVASWSRSSAARTSSARAWRSRASASSRAQGPSKLLVCGLELLASAEQLRLHLQVPALEGHRALPLFIATEGQEHGVRDVLHPVDEVEHLALGGEDRGVDGAPVPLLEIASLGLGTADVVLLHGHGVRRAGGPRSLERGAQVAHARGVRIRGVVGEHLEQGAAKDALAGRHGGTQVGIADGHEGEVRVR